MTSMDPNRQAWFDRARAHPVEGILEKRGFRLPSGSKGERIYCATELNPQLAEPNGRFGKLEITRLYTALRLRLETLRPKLVVLEASADLFGGEEISKTQVRQFIAYL